MRGKNNIGISLETKRQRESVHPAPVMNNKGTRQHQKHSSGHGNFKHVAEPATLDTVLDAFGLKKSEYKHTKKAVLNRTRALAHAR